MNIEDEWKDVEKPKDADFFAWESFVRFAIREGIGGHPDDYGDWWGCWKGGYIAAMNEK